MRLNKNPAVYLKFKDIEMVERKKKDGKPPLIFPKQKVDIAIPNKTDLKSKLFFSYKSYYIRC